MRLQYRPALDGVRALAVLLVIAYHVSTHATGGFLGVDAFFVLSGYLITTLLMAGFADRGLRSLSEFWTRRARRLLPALLILVAVSAIVIAATASVTTFAARRGDMFSTLFYYANWHFIAVDESYFTQFLGASPLRHAWSLAIEEQFYLLWPLLLFGALALSGRAHARRRTALVSIVLLATIASGVDMALRFDPANPSPSYYATDARAQQLLLGAVLAILLRDWRARPPERVRAAVRRGWPLVVLALVAMIGLTHAESRFYASGGATLFALLVALLLLIIELEPNALPARMLSLRPLTWIGMISYGLYLWHWPLVVWLSDPSIAINYHVKEVLEVGGTFLIATVSFYLVERPVRRGDAVWIGSSAPRFAAAIAICMILVTGVVVRETQIPGSSALAAELTDTSDTGCPPGSPVAGGFSWCVRASGRGRDAPEIATAGDSTARALDPGLRQFALSHGWRYVQAAQGGCSFAQVMFPPTPDGKGLAQAHRCVSGIPPLIADVMRRAPPRVWVYSDRWAEVAIRRQDGTYLQPLDPRREPLLVAALLSTMHRLTAHGARVLLVAQPPPGQPVDCAVSHGKDCASAAFSTDDPVTAEVDRIYQRVAQKMRGRVVLVSVTDVLCPPPGRCPAELRHQLVRYDQIHYTGTFSRRIVPVILARARALGLPLR